MHRVQLSRVMTMRPMLALVSVILGLGLLAIGCQDRASAGPPLSDHATVTFSPRRTQLDAKEVVVPWEAQADATIPVMINGQGPFRFALNTSSQKVALTKGLSERLRLPRLDECPMVGADKTIGTAVINALDLGGAHFQEFKAPILEDRSDLRERAVDGLLGIGLFSKLLFTCDYPKRCLRFAEGGLPEPDGREILHLGISENDHPSVLLLLQTPTQSRDDWHRICPAVDGEILLTAFRGLDLSTPLYREPGKTPDEPETQSGRLQQARIGAYAIERPIVSMSAAFPKNGIGRRFLAHFTLTLDQANQRVRFAAPDRLIVSGPRYEPGFTCTVKAGTKEAVVTQINAAAPVAQFLHLGDHIVSRPNSGEADDATAGVFTVLRGSQTRSFTIPYYDPLPWVYRPGQGIPPDEREAVLWRQRSAERGLAYATYLRGRMYYLGEGLPKDEAKAYAYFRQAADQGDDGAQLILGKSYHSGDGITATPDLQAAFLWFQKSARQGNAAAQCLFGIYYMNGMGIAQNTERSLYWLLQSAERGNAAAQGILATFYLSGGVVARDGKVALEWARKAAEQNHAGAQRIMGEAHLKGEFLPQDEPAAFAWLSKAAEQGDSESQLWLFKLYQAGRGVEKDESKGLAWLRKAAATGLIEAQETLRTWESAHLKNPAVPPILPVSVPDAANLKSLEVPPILPASVPNAALTEFPRQVHLDTDEVTVPWVDKHKPIVQVMINGQGPFRFLVDTGCSSVNVTERLAQFLKLPRIDEQWNVNGAANVLGTPILKRSERVAIIRSLNIGGAHFTDFKAAPFDESSSDHDGIVGSSLFTQTLITFDYATNRLLLTRGSLPEPDGKEILPIVLEANNPHVLVRLQMTNGMRDEAFLIDTGFENEIGFPCAGVEFSSSAEEMSVVGITGHYRSRKGRIDQMRMGAYALERPVLTGVSDAVLGQAFLRRFTMTLDYANKRVRFATPNRLSLSQSTEEPGYEGAGCDEPGKEGIIVTRVHAYAPAGRVLQVGDRITAINACGAALAGASPDASRSTAPKDMVFIRGEQTMHTTICAYDPMYRPGHDAPIGEQEAAAWHKRAAQSLAFSQYVLGKMHGDDGGLPHDAGKSMAYLRQAAEQGDAGAQCALGAAYHDGKGVACDERAAFQWMEKAAQQGYGEAQYNLSQFFSAGRGVDKDEARALEWLRKAAAIDPTAQSDLGVRHFYGRQVERDEKKAADLLRRAAEQGEASGQYRLGILYAQGISVAKDAKTAFVWMKMAAEQGYPQAQYTLSQYYYAGKGVARDDGIATFWLRKAAEQGHAPAQVKLGRSYLTGSSVPLDLKAAFTWISKAAEQNDPEGQLLLFKLYQAGQGVEKDESKGLPWLRKAAAAGLAEAQEALRKWEADNKK